MSLETLVELSNRYGTDRGYVAAGGGNTSWKNEVSMYVKGSGTELATIKAEGFVKMDLSRLDQIWKNRYSEDTDEREEQVLSDMMAARCPSEMEKRPSVESLLHALIPYTFVVHTHPTLVNGVTCSARGEETVRELFGDKVVWIPVTDPGYTLAKEVYDRVKRHTAKGERSSPESYSCRTTVCSSPVPRWRRSDETYEEIFSKIRKKVGTYPVEDASSVDDAAVREVRDILEPVLNEELTVVGIVNQDILDYAVSEDAFEPLSLSLTPDHIVYYGFKPVYVSDLASLGEAVQEFVRKHGDNPRLAVVKGLGAFSFHSSASMAEKGADLFLDDVNVTVFTRSFGGHLFMPVQRIDFIRNWEAEKYRASLSK